MCYKRKISSSLILKRVVKINKISFLNGTVQFQSRKKKNFCSEGERLTDEQIQKTIRGLSDQALKSELRAWEETMNRLVLLDLELQILRKKP